MIRKQLYIGEEHDRALKRRAAELGVSEAELVRRLLDGLVAREGGGAPYGTGETSALDAFFVEADRTSESHGFPEGYRFDRDGLYEDRGEVADGAGGA
ncbi:MAG: ribbon-helix-helix domain-containing protein [Actinomycetota bacterium]|nr:ribbon-helix-helix domain-containing protein [Actinomycetota bacterium]